MNFEMAIERANEIAAELSGIHLKDDFRSNVSGAMFAVAQQHHAAILILLNNKPPLHATAFALLRPLIETTVRGLWLLHVVEEQKLNDFVVSGTKLDMASMIQSLDKISGLTAYEKLYKGNWSVLSSYTHTGELQVQRWLRTNDIEP